MQIIKRLLDFLRALFNKIPPQAAPVPAKDPAPVIPLPVPVDPPWLIVARKELGVSEFRSGNNPKILDYHRATNLELHLINQITPWCSSFVSWCLEQCGIRSSRSAWARSYLNWGIKLNTPKYGCITVFTRNITSGHVGFYIDERDDLIYVLSGNHKNSVCIAGYPKADLLGYRWPDNF